MTTTVSSAVAKQDNTPTALVQKYSGEFASVLPSHVKPETWVRIAVGALRRDPKLAEAAGNNMGALMSALLTAARLGLEPGTEQFYLTPRKVRGRLEVMGITGYQGLVELMYRSGAVSSVIVENVFEKDRFEYVPGRHDRPIHEVDWDLADRGALRLVYAYGVMKDGATSKVVVLNRADIKRIRASSESAKSEYSPWNKHEPAMWMKSAARQLAKWLPTSAEYIREQLRAEREVAQETTVRPVAVADGNGTPMPTGGLADDDEPRFDPETGEVIDAELVDEGMTEGEWAAGA